MMQFSGRFLILTFLAIGAVCSLQCSPAFAEDPPAVASVPPVAATTWGCGWKACIGTSDPGSGVVSGYASAELAGMAALQKAMEWHRSHCASFPPSNQIGIPFEESLVAPPVEEAIAKDMQVVTSTFDWVVLFRCTPRCGTPLEIQLPGQTFCEAYSGARNIICTAMNYPEYGGACCCCYRVVKRPICCRCVTHCR